MPERKEIIEVAGHAVPVSHPDKVYFPRTGHTKLDIVRYYLSVADGALRGVAGRPMVLKRFVNGADGEPFFQKRAPSSRPAWIETVVLSFPSGRTAEEVVLRDAAGLAWVTLRTRAAVPGGPEYPLAAGTPTSTIRRYGPLNPTPLAASPTQTQHTSPTRHPHRSQD